MQSTDSANALAVRSLPNEGGAHFSGIMCARHCTQARNPVQHSLQQQLDVELPCQDQQQGCQRSDADRLHFHELHGGCLNCALCHFLPFLRMIQGRTSSSLTFSNRRQWRSSAESRGQEGPHQRHQVCSRPKEPLIMLNHGLILGTSDQCSTADQAPHSGQGGWIDTWGGAPTVSRDLHPGLILRRQSAMPLPNRLIRKNPEP